MINPCRRADVAFTYINEIGQEGRNSKVHLANDDHLNQEIVIKEVIKDGVNNDEFFREARVLYLSAHPNVVQINYAAQDDERIYISMPYYKKGSLSSLMRNKNLTAREIIRYSIHFLSGLHHIHSKGLMHFDIKPNNIMLSDRDEALLADFGLAERMDIEGLACPGLIYTVHIAPEHFSQPSFSFTYDIYQAGLTIYRMAVGEDRFSILADELFERGVIESDICDGTFPIKTFEPNIPKPLQSIIKKCLAIDPANRYQSVLEILNDLSTIDECCLDWRLTETEEGKSWKKYTDGVEFTLNVVGSTSTCYRVNQSGRRTRYGEMCRNDLTAAKLYKLLKDNG